MALLLEIALGLVALAAVLAAVLRRGPLRPWPGPGRRRGGDAGAGDRAARTPRTPVLSGGAAKRLGEDD